MVKTVYWLNELSRDSLAVAGGKGANLGEMYNRGFPVPNAFVVSSEAYFDFVRRNRLDQVIRDACGALDVQDTQALNAAAERVRTAILAAPVPADIRDDITRAYNQLCGATIPSPQQEVFVAVRSSATAEDLPEASFAGQQETYLNVKGADGVVENVRKCWASLFGARAIYYRQNQGFDHLKVGIAVPVQKMVQSEKAGVMFSINPVTNDDTQLVIEGAFGLGEAVVSGSVTPDEYVVDKKSNLILSKTVQKQERMIVRTPTGNAWVDVPEELQETQKLTEKEVLELAKHGKELERHYQWPQDVEWAVEQGRVYIVQTRAVTTTKKKTWTPQPPEPAARPAPQPPSAPTPLVSTLPFQPTAPPGEPDAGGPTPEEAEPILQGLAASPGIASGVVRVVLDIKEIYKVKQGDVLVTRMTTPDFVPAMKRAIAIITDEGGLTAHAAIVSRELGVPCIVGTRRATATLHDGDTVTVDAKRGMVYAGKVQLEGAPAAPEQKVAAAVAQATPLATGTRIYVNLAEPESAERVAAQNVDGVGLLRAEFMIAAFGKHPKMLLKQGREKEFVDYLAKGLRKFCAAFHPRPVIYRATDFKTNEYRNLEGGAEFEPQEENPMIGYRGCFRYLKDPVVFNLELEAIKRVRDQYGLRNLQLMIPVVRTIHEFQAVRRLVEASGLYQSRDFHLGIMCEVPSTVILADDFCKAGVDFMSIGSNDLTQLTLGIDRDNPVVAEDFDERDPAVLDSMRRVIQTCRRNGVKVGICGQAPSVYPEVAEALVAYGIDSISVNPDVIDRTRRIVASAEKRVLLQHAREAAARAQKP